MFYLRTGTPGAGKTLSIIDELRTVVDRPIYYSGIPGLKLDWHKIDNPLDYHNELPDGSIYVLDECQQYFPVRSPSAAVPPAISFLETHRHRGIDIYFITQHPSLLDHHARRLVGQHTHLQRNFGMPFAVKYVNNKLFDATNYFELQSCEKSNYRYPKEVFDLYKSAETHTHKAKFPKKVLWIIPLLFAVIYGIYTIYSMLHKTDSDVKLPAASEFSINAMNPMVTSEQPVRQWATAFIPQVQSLPYTAPLYENLVEPQVYPVITMCWSSPAECHCYTQQATKVDLPETLCRMMVAERIFNPFKLAKTDDDEKQKKTRKREKT